MSNRTEKTHNSAPTSYRYDDGGQMTATQALAGGVAYASTCIHILPSVRDWF